VRELPCAGKGKRKEKNMGEWGMFEWVTFSEEDREKFEEMVPGISSGSINLDGVQYAGMDSSRWTARAVQWQVDHLRRQGDKRAWRVANELEKHLYGEKEIDEKALGC